MEKQRILSGMRPTGPLHVGNYVGALQNWAELQDEFDCHYFIADWHALMSEYRNPSVIRENTYQVVADWLAAGLDPERSVLFVQSHIPWHAELHVILSCITPVSWLERCPTYKEQVKQLSDKDVTNYAFLGYPVLQASDIILYRAHRVPVGEDQLPHLELTREITRRFNSVIGEVFPEPKAKTSYAPRLLGTDGRKMSKSYDNQIELGEEPDSLRAKVMKMFTDPKRIKRDDPGHPEECNVCDFWKVFSPDNAEEVAETCRNATLGCVDCKKKLAEVLIEFLAPMREKRNTYISDRAQIDRIIKDGDERSLAVADETMKKVHEVLGF